MNNNFSQENTPTQKLLTTRDWWDNRTDRLALWRDFLFKKAQVSWELEYWFYWMAYFMEHQLGDIITTLGTARTKDVRYTDQIRQMSTHVEDVLHKCRCVLTAQRTRSVCAGGEFPCRIYRDRFRCYCSHRHMTKIGGLMMCKNTKDALIEDVAGVMNAFIVEWLCEYYYVWKMTRQRRIRLPMAGDILPMPLHDIRLWEVVCEDDDKQILSHPLLPHPSDFLEKRVADNTSTLYADKARFEYQIPGSLSRFPVVLLPGVRSIIPRMTPSPQYQQETVRCGWKQPTPQILYRETCTEHKEGSQPHKKRRLSKILKEGRKKKKTLWTRHRRAKNPPRLMMFHATEQEDCAGIYDEYDDDIDAFSDNSPEYYGYDYYDDYDYLEWWY